MQNPKYVILPIDITTVKRAWIMGFTKHQILSGCLGAAVGIIPFFVLLYLLGANVMGITTAGLAFFICGAPVTFVFVYEKNGIRFNRYIRMVKDFFTKPRKRLYRSRNLAEYAALEKEKFQLERSLKHGYIYQSVQKEQRSYKRASKK